MPGVKTVAVIASKRSDDNLSAQEPELSSVLTEFQVTYQKFVNQYHGNIVRIERVHIANALQGIALDGDINLAAITFESQLGDVLATIHHARLTRARKWTGILTVFLRNLLPLAITCFRFTSAVSGATDLAPLKGVADGVSIILQVSAQFDFTLNK